MRHTLIELGHVALGLAAVALLSWGAAWAYPLGAAAIRPIGWIAAVLIVIMNVGTVRAALARDRQHD